MNKNFLYFLLLSILIAFALFLYSKQTLNTLQKTDANFAIQDTANITQIIITDKAGVKINLQKQTNTHTWVANEYFAARQDAINNLLTLTKNLKVKGAVSKEALPNVNKMMQNPLRTVQIFMKDNADTPAKTYYIGGVGNNNEETYFLMKGATTPYIVQMHAHIGNILPFYFTQLDKWKSRLIFNYTPAQITNISVEYPENMPQSFKIDNNNPQKPTLNALNPQYTIENTHTFNEQALNQYISSFTNIYAEGFEDLYPKTDSLRSATPYCIITVNTKNTQYNTNKVTIYKRLNYYRSKSHFDEKGKPLKYDPDHYFAFIHNGKSLVQIQEYNFGKLFKEYAHFFKIND